MPSPVVLKPVISGLPFSGTDYNNNMGLIESGFYDVAPYVISGLTISAGSGLSVNVTSGVAVIGAEITMTSFVIGSLAPSTTVHLYLLQNGSGTSNTTGAAPAKSVKLGTAVTGVATVTSVAMGRTSGRQQFVQPQNLVPGGPSAGTASAGHLDGLNLASWGAADAEGQAFYGVLPSGAVPGPSAPLTVTLNDANQNSVQVAATFGHTYNAGGGATGIGVEVDLLVESSTNGTNRVAANLQATLTDLTPSTATGKLSVGVIDNNTQVIPLTVASKDIRIPQAAAAAAQHGLLNVGSGGFDGSAGHFAGTAGASGTYLAMNAPSGYTGMLWEGQVNGVSRVQFWGGGTMNMPTAAAASANFGLVNLGPGAFDGSSTGKFVGSASGTYLALNTESGFAGDLARFQHQGSDRWRVTDTGDVTMTVRDAATAATTTGLTVAHRSSGTPAALFGTKMMLQLDNASNGLTNAGAVEALWSTATAANESSILKLYIRYNGTDCEVARCRPVGTAPSGGIGGQFQASSDFLHAGTLFGVFNKSPAAQQTGGASTAAATYGATEQTMLQKAYDCLRTFGFLT